MKILDLETAYGVVEESLKSRNYSAMTIRAEYYTLRRFGEYLKTAGKPDFRDAEEKDYAGFMKYLERKSLKKSLKPTTLRHFTEHLKAAYAILETEEKVIRNPFSGIGSVRVEKRFLDRVLTEAEMEAVLDSADVDGLTGARDRCILEVFYGTGVRRKELIGLEVTDYLEEEKMLFIRRGKGGKDRIIPLGDNVNRYLKFYIKKVRPKLAGRRIKHPVKTRAVFLNKYGGKLQEQCLSPIFREIRERCREKTGLDKEITPHVIRHSFATHLINRGADVREVQLLMGHASIDSTECYLKMSASRLKEAYEKYHPFENELYFDVYERERYILDWK